MSETDALDERLRAVERALTDGDDDLTALRDAAATARELDAIGERLDDVEARLDDLDAATQALRGYVGNVRAVNESVERRADAALAKAEAMEADRDGSGHGPSEPGPSTRGERPVRSESTVPCGCQSRRSGTPTDPTGESGATTDADSIDDSDSNDPGLLARIAEAL